MEGLADCGSAGLFSGAAARRRLDVTPICLSASLSREVLSDVPYLSEHPPGIARRDRIVHPWGIALAQASSSDAGTRFAFLEDDVHPVG